MDEQDINTKLYRILGLRIVDESFLEKKIELLEKIKATGSITKAAKALKLSYKTAWDSIDKMNNMSDKPLVISVSGGRDGGGTRLTERAEDIIRIYRLIEDEQRNLLDRINGTESFNEIYENLRKISMRTSARNQLSGRILEIKRGAVNSEVTIGLKGDDKITSIITNESVESLALKKGKEAYALIKSSWIIISKGRDDIAISARNKLLGKVHKIITGMINSQVVLILQGGNTITSIITNESLNNLGLKEGDDACAIFKASSVIVGIF